MGVCSFSIFPDKSELPGHRMLLRSYLWLRGIRARGGFNGSIRLGLESGCREAFRVGDICAIWSEQPFRPAVATWQGGRVRMPPSSSCIQHGIGQYSWRQLGGGGAGSRHSVSSPLPPSPLHPSHPALSQLSTHSPTTGFRIAERTSHHAIPL